MWERQMALQCGLCYNMGLKIFARVHWGMSAQVGMHANIGMNTPSMSVESPNEIV